MAYEKIDGLDGSAPLIAIAEMRAFGIPTRSVDDLVRAMGMSGISKSQVLRLCEEIDGRVKAVLNRPIEGDWPFLWIGATYLKVRRGGRIISVAVIIGIGVNTDGRREALGLESSYDTRQTGSNVTTGDTSGSVELVFPSKVYADLFLCASKEYVCLIEERPASCDFAANGARNRSAGAASV